MREKIRVPCGRVKVYQALPNSVYPLASWKAVTPWQHNDVLYEWGAIVGNLLLRQGTQYGIGGMYIEYQNVADPDDAVTAPGVTRDATQGLEYYTGLSSSENTDYLRVSLIAGLLNISDAVKFPKGNEPTFYAQTTGISGVNGKPFATANNSKVFGGALVAFVDAGDPSQDLVFSRFYLDAGQQQLKLESSQIGFEWQMILE